MQSAQTTVPGAQDSARAALRILSFNVRTWTRDRDADSDVYWRTRMAAMEQMILDVDPDIICFQEMLFPATRYVPRGYRRVSGVNISHPIFVRKGLKYKSHSLAVRWEACTVEGIRIINVHSSWDREIMLRTVEQVNAQLTGCAGAIDHFFLQGLTPLHYRMITDGYGCAKMSDHYPILLDVRK